MGKEVFKTGRKIRKEHAQIQGAARKRGLWSSLGSALLGGLAALVTGGASIAVQAAVAAAGTFAGGHIGNFLAGTTDEGKLKGGRFFQGSRTSLSKQIKEGINVGALKAGLMAGLSAVGGKFKFGKEGASVTAGKEGFKLGNLFKPGESAHTYKDTFWGKVGKTLDFKGSAIGQGLESMAEKSALKKAVSAAGEQEKFGEFLTQQQDLAAEFGEGGADPLGLQRMQVPQVSGQAEQEAISQLKSGGPFLPDETSWSRYTSPETYRAQAAQLEPMTSPTIGTTDYMSDVNKIDVPEMDFWKRRNQDRLTSRELLQKQKTEKLWDWEKSPEGPDFIGPREIVDPIDSGSIRGQSQWDTFKSSEAILDPSMAAVSPQIPEVAGGPAKLTTGQRVAYDKINKMSDAGYNVSAGGGLPEEYGEGYIDLDTGETRRPPTRPNVPVASEDEFFDKDITIEDTDFDDFDEASWEAGRKRLQQVDADLARQQYWGSGTPAVEALSESETGTGLKYHQYQPQTDTDFGLQSSDYDLLAPSRKRASDLQRSLKTRKKLNLYPRLFPGD